MREKICPECGAAFMPRNGSQVCCSDECKRNRHRRQMREYQKRNRKLSPRLRMLENLRKRDALCPKPRTEVIFRNGVRVETRGQCCIAPHFSPLVAVHHKSYYYG